MMRLQGNKQHHWKKYCWALVAGRAPKKKMYWRRRALLQSHVRMGTNRWPYFDQFLSDSRACCEERKNLDALKAGSKSRSKMCRAVTRTAARLQQEKSPIQLLAKVAVSPEAAPGNRKQFTNIGVVVATECEMDRKKNLWVGKKRVSTLTAKTRVPQQDVVLKEKVPLTLDWYRAWDRNNAMPCVQWLYTLLGSAARHA